MSTALPARALRAMISVRSPPPSPTVLCPGTSAPSASCNASRRIRSLSYVAHSSHDIPVLSVLNGSLQRELAVHPVSDELATASYDKAVRLYPLT